MMGGDIFDFKQKHEVTDGINHEDAEGEVLWAEEIAWRTSRSWYLTMGIQSCISNKWLSCLPGCISCIYAVLIPSVFLAKQVNGCRKNLLSTAEILSRARTVLLLLFKGFSTLFKRISKIVQMASIIETIHIPGLSPCHIHCSSKNHQPKAQL